MAAHDFSKQRRLITAKDYQRALRGSKRLAGPYFLIRYCKNNQDHPRLGLSIAKRKVAKAVNRNRIKRIVRESFRERQDQLNPFDFVVLANNGIAEADKTQLRQAIDKQWETFIASSAKVS